MAEIEQAVNTTTRMVVAVFKKRSIDNKHEGQNPKIPKHNPRR